MSLEGKQLSPILKSKPKKKSLVERELETSLTDKFIVPATTADKSFTSRYGRARRLKTDNDFHAQNKLDTTKSPQNTESPPVYRMHASNSPGSIKTTIKIEKSPDSLIENIYNDNLLNDLPKKSCPKIYIRKDLIQRNGKEEKVKYVKNIFSPITSTYTPSNSHLNNYFERSSEKYSLNTSENLINMSSVVKTLDFDGNKKKKTSNVKQNVPKSEVFEIEAKCVYQVGDLAWARMGTYPFWPCIVTRDPETDTFVKKKLFGRVEHDIINVTFFGDNGRHSWVVDNMLRLYQGKNEFLDVREKFSVEDKKKDPRLYAAFFVSEKKQKLWNMSVEEAETLLKEPKRLRIDLFNSMLWQSRAVKVNTKKVGKVTRTDSDVSLSESLYDTLFSEEEIKDESLDRSKNKKKIKGLDVSDVVTACLDNMAAKTGITTIQKQSHMDRWLQKAKSKTPEKNKITLKAEKEVDLKLSSKKAFSRNTSSEESVKSSSDTSRNTSRDRLKLHRPIKTLNNKKLRTRSSRRISRKSHEFMNTSLTSFENEHDYSSNFVDNIENQSLVMNENDSVIGYVQENGGTESVFGAITKVESLSDGTYESSHEIETSVVNDDIISHESENSFDNLKSNNLTNGFDSNLKDEASSNVDNHTKDVTCNIEETIEKVDMTESNKKVTEKELTVHQQIMAEIKPDDFINHQKVTSDEEQINTHKDGNVGEQNITEVVKNTNKQITDHNENTEISNDKPVLLNGIKETDLDNSCGSLEKILNNTVAKTRSADKPEAQKPETAVSITEVSLELNSHTSCDHKDTEIKNPSNETDTKHATINDVIDEVDPKLQNENTKVSNDCVQHEIDIANTDEDSDIKQDNTSKVLLDLQNTELSITEGRITTSPFEFTNMDKLSKESSPERFDDFDTESSNSEISEIPRRNKNKDSDTISIKSNSSNSSFKSKRSKNVKQLLEFDNIDVSKVLEDSDFKKYLELRQDQIIDENPELSENEVIKYLYKTFIYEESSKGDKKINDDFDGFNVVKGLSLEKPTSKLKRKVNKLYSNVKLETVTQSCNESEGISKRSLRSRTNSPHESLLRSTSASPADFLKEPKLVLRKMEDENESIPKDTDSEVASIDSESSDVPLIIHTFKQNKTKVLETTSNQSEKTVENTRKKEIPQNTVNKVKELQNVNDAMECPEFIKYLEIKQDNVTDEHPELSQDEIVFYLYKTWIYEEGSKNQSNRIDELEQENLVKGLNTDVHVNKVKKKVKTESKIDKFLVDTEVKDKPKRNIANPDYNERNDHIEEEMKYFEIFSKKNVKEKKVDNEKKNEHSTDSEEFESPKFALIGETNKDSNIIEETAEIDQTDVYNEVEQYFINLTKPKPNLFKGLVREKVCEICEMPAQLVKCKGCHQMFHPECVKKETELVEVPQQVRGRKKKKKPRGRKPKNLDDSIESDGDEKNDLNDSDEKFNISLEGYEPIVADADNFETKFQEKIKEIMDVNKNPYECIPSNYAIDWTKSVAGNCEIINVSPAIKHETDYSEFKCNNCQKSEVPICFVCKSPVSSKNGIEQRQKCQSQHCYKYYHLECLDSWPQTQFTGDAKRKLNEHFNTFTCPRHVCHTCVCDDPRGCKTRFNGEKLARCIRCPATYHTFTKCLPAGTQVLSGSHIVCPRHYEHRPGKVPCHVNTGWCFICALGGTLICCEYCPTSFHAECLNIKPPEGGYMCEDCETGRLPLYGEMVWVKLGHYRWWPGMILHPSEIPNNIMAVRHSPGEFVVRFFGQYDHYWVNRGRVFPFQEGDSGRVSGQKSKIDAAFTMAMEHAQRACQILKNAVPNNHEESDIASSLLPPHYVKLKVNKPIGSLIGKRIDLEESSLTQCDCDPRESDPCGPYTHCLNRMLLTECGPSCKAGDRCQNRAFEKREYPKMVPYRTPHRGWGLKTLEDIKMGQFVIEYVGELLDEDEFRRRMAKMHEIRDENFYFLTLDKERMIDAGPKGNLARFMNHCCEPNCETQKWTVLGDVRVGLFALRDIPAGSEVTFNYNLECAGIDKKKCMCGAKLCSGYIGAKPKQGETQTKKLKRTYKRRPKQIEESPTVKSKPKARTTSRSRPKEMSEIEKDLLIIKNATNGLSSDSESGRINSSDCDKVLKPLKRKRVSFSTDNEVILINSDVREAKRLKTDFSDFGD